MNEFAASDSARNWVGFLVPRAVLLLCTRCRNKKEVSGLCSFRQLKILSAVICSKLHTKTDYEKFKQFLFTVTSEER